MPEKMQRKLFGIFYSRIKVFYDKLKINMHNEEEAEEKLVSLKRSWEEYLLGFGLERFEGSVVGGPLRPMGEDSVIIRCPLINKDSPRSWLVIPQDLASKILTLGILP